MHAHHLKEFTMILIRLKETAFLLIYMGCSNAVEEETEQNLTGLVTALSGCQVSVIYPTTQKLAHEKSLINFIQSIAMHGLYLVKEDTFTATAKFESVYDNLGKTSGYCKTYLLLLHNKTDSYELVSTLMRQPNLNFVKSAIFVGDASSITESVAKLVPKFMFDIFTRLEPNSFSLKR